MRIPHDCDDNYDDDDVGFVFVMNIILIILVLRWSWLVALTQLFLGSWRRKDRYFWIGIPCCTVVWDHLVCSSLTQNAFYAGNILVPKLNPFSCIVTLQLIHAIYLRILLFYITFSYNISHTTLFSLCLFLLHIYITRVIIYGFLLFLYDKICVQFYCKKLIC